MSSKALTKSLGHVTKHHKSDCIGVLLGSKTADSFNVTDIVPLFHDHAMTSAVETALEMVELFATSTGLDVLGLYDAPLKFKGDEGNSS